MIGFVVGRLAVGLVVGAVLALGASAAGTALGETLTDGPVPARELCRGAVCVPEADALRATIKAERAKARRDTARAFERGRRSVIASVDHDVTFKLAGLFTGQDPAHLKACALDEGYGESYRNRVLNLIENTEGSGAFGAVQFKRGTYLDTLPGRWGLDWRRVDVQIFAMADYWRRGNRSHWAGPACR